MTLTNRDIVELTEWRRKLHRQPEISNDEEKTAKEVVSFLADTGPDRVFALRIVFCVRANEKGLF